ncbi:MAG: FliH/SctL family protein [Geminicoccaceae bacterium]
MTWLAPLDSIDSPATAETWTSRTSRPCAIARPALWPVLDEEAEEGPPPSHALSFTENELTVACAAAARRAVAEADAGWRQTIESRRADSLKAMSRALDAALERSAADRQELQATALDLAWTLARKIAGAALARAGEAEVAALLASLLPDLEGVRYLRVSLAPSLVEAARPELARITASLGDGFVLDVVGDPALPPGDARVVWSDGWAERCRAAIEDELADRLQAWSASTHEPEESAR